MDDDDRRDEGVTGLVTPSGIVRFPVAGYDTVKPAIMPIAKCGAPVCGSGTKQMAM